MGAIEEYANKLIELCEEYWYIAIAIGVIMLMLTFVIVVGK